MVQSDYSQMFSCPRCGARGAIINLKAAGSYIIIKQKCPTHGGRTIKIPLVQKDLVLPYIRDGVFRCFKCGQEATLDHMKVSGYWTLVRMLCPTHGNKLPFAKIWGTIYSELPKGEVAALKPAQPEPEPIQPISQEPSEEKKFCPNCGASIKGIEKYCGECGAEIE